MGGQPSKLLIFHKQATSFRSGKPNWDWCSSSRCSWVAWSPGFLYTGFSFPFYFIFDKITVHYYQYVVWITDYMPGYSCRIWST